MPGRPKLEGDFERKDAGRIRRSAVDVPAGRRREGSGATLTDVDGNTFIDFTGGVGCLNVGHSHPGSSRPRRSSSRASPHRLHDRPVRGLRRRSPSGSRESRRSRPAKAAFFNAGTEAVENSVKFARAYTKRPAVIGFEGGFHGRTLLSMTLTARRTRTRRGSGRSRPRCIALPFAKDYRGAERADGARGARARWSRRSPPSSVAAIVVEPVQGEGGFVVAPPDFLQGVRRICDEHGIVHDRRRGADRLGRTGGCGGSSTWGSSPSLITVAKSIAAGLPLSAVLGNAEIMDAPGVAYLDFTSDIGRKVGFGLAASEAVTAASK